MRAAGMIRREDLAEFSQELQGFVFYEPPGQNAEKSVESRPAG